MPPLDALLVDTKTAMHVGGFKKTKFFRACLDGELERVKQGRKTLVTVASLRRYVEKLTAAARASGSRTAVNNSMQLSPCESAKESPATITRKPRAAKRAEVRVACDKTDVIALAPPLSIIIEPANVEPDGAYDDAWLALVGAAEPQSVPSHKQSSEPLRLAWFNNEESSNG